MNSFNAPPGYLSYDDDAYPDQPTNCVCPECGARFWKSRDDSGGDLCNRCVNAAWLAEQERRVRLRIARLEAERQALQSISFNKDKD